MKRRGTYEPALLLLTRLGYSRDGAGSPSSSVGSGGAVSGGGLGARPAAGSSGQRGTGGSTAVAGPPNPPSPLSPRLLPGFHHDGESAVNPGIWAGIWIAHTPSPRIGSLSLTRSTATPVRHWRRPVDHPGSPSAATVTEQLVSGYSAAPLQHGRIGHGSPNSTAISRSRCGAQSARHLAGILVA